MEKHNPNSHERPKSWSDLPPDLVNLVFERLSFANFRRAKSVCSSWYAASRQSLPKNQIHWLILFPQDNNSDNSSCTLFNPEEEDKLYNTRDLGAEFAKSVCRATFGNWLLMQDALNNNIYIVNLFTHERINLPHLELLLKDYESRTSHHKRTKYRGRNIRSPPVFWIDEKTKDYVVVLGFRDWCVFYSKKGDSSWNQIPQTSDCFDYFDIVYKDRKLYFLSNQVRFKIFDLSGEIPQQTFQCVVRTHMFQGLGPQLPNCHQLSNSWLVAETKFVVTVTGDVLKVERMLRPRSGIQSFRVYKVYSSSGFYKNEEKVDSLGDESMLFDQGITVLANDPAGFIPNSIYFSNNYRSNYNDYYGKDTKYIYIFNLETQKTEPLHTFDSSSFKFSRTQWFVPSFTHT